MNGVEGFIIGMFVGAVVTIISIMLFAKYMNKTEKEAAIKRGKERWKKKN